MVEAAGGATPWRRRRERCWMTFTRRLIGS
jgi:hypothetical protein